MTPAARARSVSAMVAPLFGATLFASAFLMFLVEPMVAKMVLPILGGAPMVWNTCVVFFQITLVAGYAGAHGVETWLPQRIRALVYGGLLVLPLATLPFAIQPQGAPPVGGSVVIWLLGVLALAIGLPFLVLSTSASLLQRLFSRTDHRDARDPYFLYTASNLGSFLALVAYPLLVEPTFTLHAQRRLWALGYVGFAALALVCIGVARRRETMSFGTADSPRLPTFLGRPLAEAPITRPAAPFWQRRARWVMLAFVPSSLMLAVTTYLSTDIAAVPLLWVVPLGLYLLTFVVAFGPMAGVFRRFADRRLPLVVVALAVFLIVHAVGPVWIVLPLHLLAFAMAGVLCHGELADDRPPAEHLTAFYFWIAVGGMAGGLFNTLVAPAIFSSVVEYPLVLLLACACRRQPIREGSRLWQLMDYVMPAAIAIGTAACLMVLPRVGGGPRLALALPAFLCLGQKARPHRFTLSVAALLAIGALMPNTNADGDVLYRERTFFGVYRVSLDDTGRYHRLFHGTTLHGMQAVDPSHQGEPLTYFHRTGPFGEAFTALPRLATTPEVGVIGLGVGSLASYAGAAQRWTFFEIDPAVERIARTDRYFTYLRTCGSRCQVVLGDARRSLDQAPPGRFGLLVLDAFSSDAIPVHLMTREALSLYLSRLSGDGVLAFHISNRHLALGPIVARLAESHGLAVRERAESLAVEYSEDGKTSSHWVVMARRPEDLAPLLNDPRWSEPRVPPGTPLWTDDFSNILSALRMTIQ